VAPSPAMVGDHGCIGRRTTDHGQGCWEAFCGTSLGLCQCSVRKAYKGLFRALITNFSPASASLSSASTAGQNRQHNCFPLALITAGDDGY
jgi:hypothetical protein